MSDKCQSGRPLRATFTGICYLLGDTFRIIDLHAKEDRFATEADLTRTFGQEKWDRIASQLVVDGYFESGRYRIEACIRNHEKE